MTISDESQKRRKELDLLLSGTFNSVLSIEEKSLNNKLTQGLTITEVHTIVAIGSHEKSPMGLIASRLGVTLATLTTAINKLVKKGFVVRERSVEDRRVVLISLTSKGRKAYRIHEHFHKKMIDDTLSELTEEEERILASALGKVKTFFDSQAD